MGTDTMSLTNHGTTHDHDGRGQKSGCANNSAMGCGAAWLWERIEMALGSATYSQILPSVYLATLLGR